jgi:hypothetical protein
VPALQTEVRATSLGNAFKKMPRGFWKVSTQRTEVRATLDLTEPAITRTM